MDIFAYKCEASQSPASDDPRDDFRSESDVVGMGMCREVSVASLLVHRPTNILLAKDGPFFELHFHIDPYPKNIHIKIKSQIKLAKSQIDCKSVCVIHIWMNIIEHNKARGFIVGNFLFIPY
jgi:hypothetical protein